MVFNPCQRLPVQTEAVFLLRYPFHVILTLDKGLPPLPGTLGRTAARDEAKLALA